MVQEWRLFYPQGNHTNQASQNQPGDTCEVLERYSDSGALLLQT